MSPLQKIDTGLSAALSAWRETPNTAPDAGISVNLTFSGDLAAIEALGFETHSVVGEQALGVVRFKDIPALVAHPGVLWLAAGRRRKKDLDTAVKDIKARASAAISGPAVDGVWHVKDTTGALTHIPKATGKGVIVAIIDTGIDVTHPMFLSQLTPTRKTRILKIWDQGLTPAAIADCPDATLLASNPNTYGVEFDSADIEAHLNTGAPFAHKDCEGHGTHVAGIAAGGALFPAGGNASRVGVAPEADIIAVKYIDNPEKIFFRKPDASAGDEVGWPARFRDAVLYCLRTARKLVPPRPIVINMSFGDGAMPGDGLDEDAVWVDEVMNPAGAPGPLKFPKGAIIVKSAGNDGFVDLRQVGRIVVPASGEIVVPLRLRDLRGGTSWAWKNCARPVHKPDVGVHFWFRRTPAPLAVKFAMRLPHGADFGAEVMVGGKLELGFRHVSGPPTNDIFIAFAPTVHRYTIETEAKPPVAHPAGGTVQRHYVHFFVEPKVTGSTVMYDPGIYEMRIRAPKDTEIFANCDMESWGSDDDGKVVLFQIADEMQDGSLVHGNVDVIRESSTVDPLGRHVITVASYNDTDGDATHAEHQHISDMSSRGPLRDYSKPAKGVIAAKPDIAAPGVDIMSAEGKDTEQLIPTLPSWDRGVRFVEHSGTSMAAPMVAGVVALMLEKKPTLNTTEVRTHLSHAPRAAVLPAFPPASTHAYGVGMVDALTSHKHTP